MEWAVFSIFAIAAMAGAGGVVLARQTVHAAMSLVQTLFCVAVFFVLQEAHFLAAVQVIVYAGAVVMLFLFVIMLLGVDNEDLLDEPLRGQRALAILCRRGAAGRPAARWPGSLQPTGGPAARGSATQGDVTNIERRGPQPVHRLPLALRDHLGAAGHRRRRIGPPLARSTAVPPRHPRTSRGTRRY